VTYPVGVQAPDGTICIVYDQNRTPNGEVLMATFNEDDVRAARAVTDQACLRMVITQLQKANELSQGELN
jgi:hypothetical protein